MKRLLFALGALLAFSGVALAKDLTLRGDVAAAALPREAQATLALIKAGGPFAYAKDGSVFSNRERILPVRRRGYYREYTVPTPGARDRGARRIIAGATGDARTSGEYYYTDDHYNSFRRIRE
ncbi:MAG: ribonuclease domain-containing protein [Pseudomonadota bacterium]